MDKNLQKAAEILVECGYAEHRTDDGKQVVWQEPELDHLYEDVQLDQDTLEGRRQADAIENYMHSSVGLKNLWHRSLMAMDFNYADNHQWRLDRIKWCLEELINK